MLLHVDWSVEWHPWRSTKDASFLAPTRCYLRRLHSLLQLLVLDFLLPKAPFKAAKSTRLDSDSHWPKRFVAAQKASRICNTSTCNLLYKRIGERKNTGFLKSRNAMGCQNDVCSLSLSLSLCLPRKDLRKSAWCFGGIGTFFWRLATLGKTTPFWIISNALVAPMIDRRAEGASTPHSTRVCYNKGLYKTPTQTMHYYKANLL